ncbi:hypothetical protein [Chitinophaga vietnamensis]|uniref:hypothetical protein n=1 Tax=Chitinophaga vietnamensis TaxID=2593957 RepID=UPI001178A25F|nr:hypothetical protein [Chitinophaga vietnamensis]
MKSNLKFPFIFLAAVALLIAASQKSAARYQPAIATRDTCHVKTETSFDFADNLRKKVIETIDDKFAGGIEENGKTTWENSPDASEYYQIVLRKSKVTIKYIGTACKDRPIYDDVEACKSALKKLLGQ